MHTQRPHTRPATAFVSTYAPTVCGLASFTHSLRTGISEGRSTSEQQHLDVVRLVDEHDPDSGPVAPPVIHALRRGDGASMRQAIALLNTYDVVSIQHEFGIFGGPDGADVLELVDGLRVPLAVTFHTVLDEPSARQSHIVRRLASAARRAIVMSPTAARRLIEVYGVPARDVHVVPHGVDTRFGGPSLSTGTRPLALTWGLIGPGKGLEVAIAALAELKDLDPLPRYLIAGATHPKVRNTSGEAYRESLKTLVRAHGLQDVVEFDDRYLDRESLVRQVRTADVVLLPYASHEQVTSGVLVEAVAAGKPVIATAFPHSLELLSGGAGLVVPHTDPSAFGEALRTVLGDAEVRSAMAAEARRIAETWFWPAIGRRYDELLSSATGPSAVHRISDRRSDQVDRVAR
jgi:polysaccharide biosynthesis protein PslF